MLITILTHDDLLYHDGQHMPLVGIDDIALDKAFILIPLFV